MKNLDPQVVSEDPASSAQPVIGHGCAPSRRPIKVGLHYYCKYTSQLASHARTDYE